MNSSPRPADAPAPSQKTLPDPDAGARRVVRLCFAAALVVLALWVARSYLAALAWAAVIAIGAWPLYRRFAARMPGRVLAPLAFTALTAVVIAIPVVLALIEIGRESQAIVGWAGRARETGVPAPEWLVRAPLLGQHLDQWWRTNLADPKAAGDLFGGNANSLAEWSKSFGGQVLYRLFLALLTFMALFLLLRDGEKIAARVLALADRWLGGPGERLAERTVVAVRGVVNGTVLVAVGEGIIIGAAYVVAGVPHAVLFAILTGAFAMLPLGAWFAFTAAALVHLLEGGSGLSAALVFAWGAVVMLIGDNFVQPGLIGGAARMPFLWALIGIAGGLEVFGLVGLFLGPVVMAALLTIWREWIGAATASNAVIPDAAEPRSGISGHRGR
ncbi:MAG TPA: AI-2E family transporter [Beijerinckiaceae bacterium]|jgi:predicted PurR-regulated permease PerM